MPRVTTTNGPFIIEKILCFFVNTVSHNISMANEIVAITKAPGVTKSNALRISEKVFCPSACMNESSPIASLSQPKACGICFRIINSPMPVSIPLITDEGKK